MRRMLMVAGLSAAMAIPSYASARDACQQRAHDRKVAGTVIGGLGGALVGGAIADTKGAVIGGIGGAVVGNNVARVKCDRGRTAQRTRDVERSSSRGDARSDAARGCSYENRRYYDERGNVVYAPVQVCR